MADNSPSQSSCRHGIPSAGEKLIRDLRAAEEDAYRKTFNAPDWVLRDLPRMTFDFWRELRRIIGKQNFKYVSGSEGNFTVRDGKSVPAEPWVRATVLISPNGMERLRKHNVAKARGDHDLQNKE